MKKKICSIITTLMILFACVFASACGDKYKNLEFKVLYAYSENAEEWFDGSDGISLNYDRDGGVAGASLVFDEHGEAILYVKVEVLNVKKKHVDSITVSFASFSGLNFSSKRVKQNQVFEVPISGNVETSMKLYENNSNKKAEIPFVVSQELESMSADLSVMPAIAHNGSLNLINLNNLKYYPLHETNQIGAIYSIESIGYYGATNLYIPTILKEEAESYVNIDGVVLSVINAEFFKDTAYVIRVRATSVFHSDPEDPAGVISTTFDVYVVEGGLESPDVEYVEVNEGEDVENINIYENSTKYSSAIVEVNKTDFNSVYATVKNSHDADVDLLYAVAVYVKNSNGAYEKYEFGSAKHQGGINGLIIENYTTNNNLDENQFRFVIVDRNVVRNNVRFVYEIEELDFSFAGIESNTKDFDVVKGVVPTCITVNDSLDLTGGIQNAVVYGTTSEGYKGLELKLSANPNDDPERLIDLEYDRTKLVIEDERGNVNLSNIQTGKKIYIKFKSNVLDMQTLVLKTLKEPKFFNGTNVTEESYITVTYNLEKRETANKFAFIKNQNNPDEEIENITLNAKEDSSIFVKIYYNGVNLDSSSVKIKGDEFITFANGKNEMTLNETGAQFISTVVEASGKYDIYAIGVKKTNSVVNANVTIFAAEGLVGVQETATVSFVNLIEEGVASNVNVISQSANVKKFSSAEVDNGAGVFNFAIAKGAFAQFNVVDGNGDADTINKIYISAKDNADSAFSKTATYYNVVSHSAFDVTGRIGGKTQLLNLRVDYYTLDGGDVTLVHKDFVVQIAVYDGISNIESSITNSTIGYANLYYNEISSAGAYFNSYTASYGTPASSVVFEHDGHENISVSHATQIQVAINNYPIIKNSNAVEISFKAREGMVSALDLLDSYSTILREGQSDFLNGDLSIKLTNSIPGLNEISLTLTALHFGQISNTTANIVIKVANVDKAERITVSGNDFVEVGENSNELRMSFIDVQDGGYAEKEFSANVEFANAKSPSSIRFEEIEKALTYVLYEYELDEENNITNVKRIQNDFLNVSFYNGKVKVRAYKSRGGGLFKLVLVTKDSYINNRNPEEIIVEEEDFTTKYALTIRVEDGEVGSEYIIQTEEELMLINYNLDSHFVLGSNISITNTNFAPLGLVDGVLNTFEGSLSGQLITIVNGIETVSTMYSITLNVKGYADSTDGYRVFSLFAILDEDAEVKNLNINVSFDHDYATTLSAGAKIGAVAGVNRGEIDGVTVKIIANKNTTFDGVINAQVDFGGIVGLNDVTGEIKNSKVENLNKLQIKSISRIVHNIGLIAGTNKGTISGKYEGKEDLDNFIFDVVANLEVTNTAIAGTPIYNVGAVAGVNIGVAGQENGIVENFLIGGKIVVGANGDDIQTGWFGGIVASSTNGKIETSIALSLDLKANSTNIDVAGIAAKTENTEIENVKYVSVVTKFNSFKTAGQISGKSSVAGIVADASDGSINNSSVESFVDTINDEVIGTVGETFYVLNNGTTTAGLVANISGTNVDKSFVHANIKGGNIILTTPTMGTNTYFIGKTNGTIASKHTTYNIINGKLNDETVSVDTYMTDVTVDENTTDWSNIYYVDNTNYVKAENYDATKTYKKLDVESWINFIKQKISGVTWNSLVDDDGVNCLIDSSENWKIKENYNVLKINGVNLCFPYLIEDEEAIMIIAPQEITANIDQDYVTDNKSVYIKEFDITEYENLIKESVIVNFLNNARDEYNSHKLISDRNENNGLIDATIIPSDAQGGYNYEIIGTGRNFAYINSLNQIVFTQTSGTIPVLVRIYSAFNPDIEVYVAIYSQSLLTNLNLNASSIYYADEEDCEYEINAYTGQSNIILTLDAENRVHDISNNTIFDVYGIAQYLLVESETVADSKLDIDTSSYKNMTIKVKDGVDVESDYAEIVTFKLYLTPEYFTGNTTSNVLIQSVRLKVHVKNSAKDIQVNGEDAEITTADDTSFNVVLTTDNIDTDEYATATSIKIEQSAVLNGDIVLLNNDNHDSIKLSLIVTDGQAEVDRLLAENELTYFADLFNWENAIVSRLYLPENETDPSKAIGYIYDILLEIKDIHNYRKIANSIKFNIVVCATSNPNVNNEKDSIEILLKPTSLTTARIENYAVKTLNVNGDYSNIVTNEHIQTSIVEPGSLGNVMMIYLEPTYSNVVSASIKTSSLFVPSLNKNVQMKFTQLVLDRRKGSSSFTTLYGINATAQVGDTLELRLISEVDANGEEIYTGVICVYIQLERFSGLEETMTVELTATTGEGKTITRSRELLTTYLPGTKVLYDENKRIDDGYLIQKGTSNNEVRIKIFGYQFNSNPTIKFNWVLPTGSTYTYGANHQQITDGTNTYLIGDYISYYLVKNFEDIEYNPIDDSYVLSLILNVSEDIPAAFSVGASLSLTTKDGQLKTSEEDENTIVFYPTDYILDSVYVNDLANGRKNIEINKSRTIDLMFTTDDENNDLSETIYDNLLNYVTEDGVINQDKLARMFTYYKNGSTISFADADLHPEFEFNLVNNETISIFGLSQFVNAIEFKIWYGYSQGDNGIYVLNFGQNGDDGITTELRFSFTLNIFAVDGEYEIGINSADEIYNSVSGTWNLIQGAKYILLNDIELENVTPITTPIAQFDGNNRVISIKSFKVNPETTNFGLFGNIGTYTAKDPETEQDVTHQTILRNVIVDYSKFNGTLAVNNLNSQVVNFGGLVGVNNGGLIYNCDVINLNPTTDVNVDIIVANNAQVTFGGLVGENLGVITNSRVGRNSYTKIVATKTIESATVKKLGGLTFSIYNRETENDEVNQFAISAGALVGNNSGTISTSYVQSTNLINYSTHETANKTAGFAGENSGTISYSYAKADDVTITNVNPYAKDYVIENKGNGIVSGFVYSNNGLISNSYANIELKTESAYISGFVYSNNGTIKESYAATTMNSGDLDNNAEQPFIGVDNAGNLLSNGTLENTYYLMRSDIDNPYTQGEKDYAYALNLTNFQNGENLVGFAFVLSNIKADREQGIWSYYTLESKKRMLPELMNANVVAHSYRYEVETKDAQGNNVVIYDYSKSYELGSANNPYTISSVEDYNNVFTVYGQSPTTQNGYVRFINHIDFNNEESAIKTRSNYTLGSDVVSTKTSVEGNGMTVGGIYLDVGQAVVTKIGMFAEIKNTYIKNLNLEFATPTTNGQFSTTTAVYSGGLAGTIHNSVILNISLYGNNTTLTGKNYVGGVAGLISGTSLIYGIETNLNVKASSTEDYLFYTEEPETDGFKAYTALNIENKTNLTYSNYINKLSYAGGVAGVLDLKKRANVEYNVQFINVRGDLMTEKTFEGNKEANMIAEYVGGVAGFANHETSSFRLKYYTGEKETLRGNTAVGGIYGVCLGTILASQVTAEETTQYTYDTEMGEYIIALETDSNAVLDETKIGNTKLLEGYKYVGGVVGVALNSTIRASYAKVGIVSGEVVGGLIGLAVASTSNFSYAIPYINLYENYKYVGGLIGSVYGVATVSPERNNEIKDYENLVKYMGVTNQDTDVQFTYSTLVVNKLTFETNDSAKLDFVSANYKDLNKTYLQSNSNASLTYVYSGVVQEFKMIENLTKETSNARVMELYRLFNVKDADQLIAFEEVFSGWSVIKYWSLNEEKYFPLLVNETVDNYIDIEDEDDLDLIRTNPNGKFRVVKSFEITDPKNVEANWIIKGSGSNAFTGTLLGENKDNRLRPIITIVGLTPNTANASAGFFEETNGATISNIEFEWKASSAQDDAAININKNLTMVSGLSCKDTNSLITNVVVRANANNNGYFINTEKEISGFGGIVGVSKNTNILGATFVGKVSATIKETEGAGAYVGGIVGSVETDLTQIEEGQNNTAVINNSFVGSSVAKSEDETITYPITEFTLKVADGNTGSLYLGGIAGYSSNAAIAASSIGGVHWAAGYESINIKVELENFTENIYTGGAVGFAENGLISSVDVVSNITVVGNVAGGEFVNIGGLAGLYNLTTESELSAGIKNCAVKATIKTEDEEKLQTNTNCHVRISIGVAELSGSAILKQCLFDGEINTEESEIEILYAGGAVAFTDNFGTVEIEEVISNVIQYVGSKQTRMLYAGGLIGFANNAKVSYSASWQRIIPITHSEAEDIYVGGLIGRVEVDAKINNSYTLSSIVADSVASKSIQHLSMGSLIGKVENTIETSAVYYSSDYGLFADENYVSGQPIGKNLSAQTLIYGSSWHADLKTENGKTNNIWKTLTVNGKTRLPYLETLEEDLKMFEIIGSVEKDYVLGSAMRPNQISAGSTYSFDQEKYQYYLIVGQSGDVTPTFTTALNGILIGQEDAYNLGEISLNAPEGTLGVDGTHAGVIPEVLIHSAVSNVHINVVADINIDKPAAGLIVGLNKGVVFNCSVQGTGINMVSSTSLGLITYLNQGMVSYSYSSIELKESANSVGGIVHTNCGKLLSNYFTGYIKSSTAAGILVTNIAGSSFDPFIYNNYMAGVIEKENGHSNFSGVELNDAIATNNFVDNYSDVKFESLPGVLETVSTAELMSEKLAGSWYYTVSNGKFKDITVTAGVRTNNITFGYNYNYPIYRFNKLVQVNDQETKIQDWKNQLYTGSGEVDASEDTNGGIFTQEDRYELLTSAGSKNYEHAFKIPHFGVLTSVQGLLNKDKNFNYVVIYDLNAKGTTEGGDETFAPWIPVGTNGEVNGFINNVNFCGVFITNRYYAQTIIADSDEDLCLVSHLQNNGLFANVQDAYFADIILGSFSLMDKSGALGTNIAPSDDSTGTGAVIHNVSFIEGSVITGKDADGNFYGALFGSLDESTESGKTSKLSIKSFKTSHETDTSVSGSVMLQSNLATAGLLAGKSYGEIELMQKAQAAAEGEYDASYIAWFDGNACAGGVVGEMLGGYIYGNGNIVNIIRNSDKDGLTTGMLGGVAGKVSGSPEIHDLTISLYDPNGEIVNVAANSFGGIVATTRALSKLKVENLVLQIKGKEIQFDYKNEARQDNFYGLIVGDHDSGSIEVNSFTLQTDAGSNALFYATITTGLTKNYEEKTTNCGVGTLAGKQSGDLVVTGYNAPQVQITGNGVPNVGGIAGYYEGGTVKLQISNLDKSKPMFIVIGTTNVGGLFGYCTNTISSIKEATNGSSIDFFNSGFAYSVVIADGSVGADSQHKNFGGLFGFLHGAEMAAASSVTTQDEPQSTSITNYNTVLIGSSVLDNAEPGKYVYNGDSFEIEGLTNIVGQVLNVGGVAGKIENSQVSNMKNAGQIEAINQNSVSDVMIKADIGGGFLMAKAQNVGGVLGLLEGGNAISNVKNLGSVYGYQNVGGIVGYVGNSAGMVISNTDAINLPENDYIRLEVGDVIDDNGDTVKAGIIKDSLDQTIALDFDLASSGTVFGVVNVGGIVGYAGNNATIKQIYSNASVFGNVNVGGIVGLAEQTTLINNIVEGEIIEEEKDGLPTITHATNVKGVYYGYKNNTEEVTVIPTSVGGLAGAISQCVNVRHNVINGVKISSAEEGDASGGATISIISNPMANYKVAAGNLLDAFNNKEKLYNLESKAQVDFAETNTGFGGFVGSTSSESIEGMLVNYKNVNYLNDIDIEAQLGVNVGTYFGAYSLDDIANVNNGEDNVVLIAPTLTMAKLSAIKVDGAYNVGGIAGYINGNDQCGDDEWNLNNSTLQGNATIKLQSRIPGFYVGGLVGTTNDSKIKNIEIGVGQNINIKVDTSISYYLGGLIGRAAVESSGTEISGVNNAKDDTSTMVEGSIAANFGGLIGMLKVKAGSTDGEVKIAGIQHYPFTINTVENSNYADGESVYSANTQNGKIDLSAQAYYINQDKLNIVPSQTSYSGNPCLASNNWGWAEDYTMFKTLQRCIPMSENNGAPWDSIASIYDAESITGVSTSGETIVYTIYEVEPGVPKVYHSQYIADPLYNEKGEMLTANDAIYIENLKAAIIRAGYPEYSEVYTENGEIKEQYQGLYTGYLYSKEDGTFEQGKTKGQSSVTIKYKDAHYQFIKTIEFTEHSNSGSLFEVAGRSPKVPEWGNNEKQHTFWDYFWAVVAIVVVIVTVAVFAYFTGGAALLAFIKTGWGIATIVLVAGTTANQVMVIVNMAQEDKAIALRNAEVTYARTEFQSVGVLSSLYNREIILTGDKVTKVQSGPDDIAFFNGLPYQPASVRKPLDFNNRQYYLIPIYNPNEQGGYLVNIEGVESMVSNFNVHKYKQGKAIWKVSGIDDENKCPAMEYILYNGNYYMLVERYMFKEGVYWISMMEVQASLNPTLDLFYVPEEVSLYHQDEHNYIYGEYVDGEYTYVSKLNNKLQGSTGNYSVSYSNGSTYTFEDGVVEFKEKTFYYLQTDDDDWKQEPGIVLGYSYLEGAYYAAIGRTDLGHAPMYAKFGNKQESEPVGLKHGVDYVSILKENFYFVGVGMGNYAWDDGLSQYVATAGGTHERELKPYYYILQNEGFTTSGTADKTTYAHSESLPDDLVVAVYPYSFKKPYTVESSNINSDSKTYKKVDGDKGLKHNPTYYLYIGDFAESYDEENQQFKIYAKVDEIYWKSVNDLAEEGQASLDKTITIEDESPTYRYVYENWSSYQHKEGFKDYFKVENNTLYELETAYGINEDGLLSRYSGSYASVSQLDYNYNKYCSNAKHEFFTRYKFTNSALEPQSNFDEISGWVKSYDTETDETEYYTMFKTNNQTTYFAEVVKVSFGGIGDTRQIYNTTEEGGGTITAGYIKKYKE